MGAVTGLSELGDRRALPLYDDLLDRFAAQISPESEAIQSAVVLALAKSGSSEARRMMTDVVRNESATTSLRTASLNLLSRKPDTLSDQLNFELQQTENVELRARATLALSQRFGRDYNAELVTLSGDERLSNDVWRDVVMQLERGAQEILDPEGVSRSPTIGPVQRQEVAEQIEDWWGSGANNQMH